ncbi:MAG: hypothetical protein D6720_01865 [Gammaproteobacteria bacterium]|nr:MAG: hypothetical protein D6720_01865 [Gammaproteobacteria bacterium]
MQTITNDTEMRQAIAGLSDPQQRQLAARLVRNVLSLTDDERVARVLEIAADPSAGEEELASAYRLARTAAIESHARCGADGEWNDQAGYFVARAAEAAVAPRPAGRAPGRAWLAAMNARMARTCLAEEADQDYHDQERQAQYRIVTEFLSEANRND